MQSVRRRHNHHTPLPAVSSLVSWLLLLLRVRSARALSYVPVACPLYGSSMSVVCTMGLLHRPLGTGLPAGVTPRACVASYRVRCFEHRSLPAMVCR